GPPRARASRPAGEPPDPRRLRAVRAGRAAARRGGGNPEARGRAVSQQPEERPDDMSPLLFRGGGARLGEARTRFGAGLVAAGVVSAAGRDADASPPPPTPSSKEEGAFS